MKVMIENLNLFIPKNKLKKVALWLPFSLLLCCNNKPKNNTPIITPGYIKNAAIKIDQAKPLLQNGDLIFRSGNDEVSRAARSMNRKDTSFSHCGIIFTENDTVFVYHALGGNYNPSQALLRQPMDSFCNPKENNAFGIYRYPLSSGQLMEFQKIVQHYYSDKLKFDLFFNFFSDDKMYCSEFVFKSLNKTLAGSLTRYLRLDTIPFGVTTDDLFLLPESKLVLKESFK